MQVVAFKQGDSHLIIHGRRRASTPPPAAPGTDYRGRCPVTRFLTRVAFFPSTTFNERPHTPRKRRCLEMLFLGLYSQASYTRDANLLGVHISSRLKENNLQKSATTRKRAGELKSCSFSFEALFGRAIGRMRKSHGRCVTAAGNQRIFAWRLTRPVYTAILTVIEIGTPVPFLHRCHAHAHVEEIPVPAGPEVGPARGNVNRCLYPFAVPGYEMGADD